MGSATITPIGAAALPKIKKRRDIPLWEAEGYKHITEQIMHDWLAAHGYEAEYEGQDNLLALNYNADGTPRHSTLPDFTVVVAGQSVAIEITVCRWQSHRTQEQACNHRRELRFKRDRAKRIRSIGYGYVLVEGDWLQRILRDDGQAVRDFRWLVLKEARRASKLQAQVQAHEAGRRARRRQPNHSRRRGRHYRSLPAYLPQAA